MEHVVIEFELLEVFVRLVKWLCTYIYICEDTVHTR